MQNTVIIVSVVLGLFVVLPLVVAGVVLAWESAFPQRAVWADRAADATCAVEPTATGTAAVIRLPLEPLRREGTSKPLGVIYVQFDGGSNAVAFHGDDGGMHVSGDELVVPVQALDPAQDFSVAALEVTSRYGGDEREQTFQVGMTATAGAASCEIGASSATSSAASSAAQDGAAT